ncbi:MAG TPA: L-rhamnose/proton symporter RhaT [Fermentimonas caenicola]|jgi:L-rhamnose-H+ transport protein|uniref:L-rhamnose/proton symporter RhaT n=1 Tax=Fermentimonas caenicola TaxID=1562970 RepID=A0A098C366_9BACT|nr:MULTISPECIES: L-rhamnose/proton symporter RhaT [Lascolabacillus]MBP6176430.1 L-rhamnose/proton symporter RhaT [Fermentimonas sp.]MDI9625791.1 L-rhamnose/proton symporter RhaT [Bacteroidota bacterium]TAH60933.1 MAG: L-rhamnose/proton symporter RhaT [Fermentimonas caenicola]MBP6196324.1 L-rhamnose/proton symporter RhaT [Fermentimonas sp.]MBP7103602.1 L-rhamnose/proton symporter RhaT [Fermentimonas sp.]
MNTLIGLLIIAVGSMGQSSSYVPINKIKEWSWENFWLTQGVFAWLIFPFLGALLAMTLPDMIEIYSSNSVASLQAIGYGALWGVGGLTFGLSMRFLGIALGQSVALGTTAALGTLIPSMINGELFSPKGLILLLAVAVTLIGIALVGYAGSLRSKNMSEEEKRKAIKDFALKKGLLIALLSGVMSACFNLGLNAGIPIREAAVAGGVSDLFAQNPVTLLVTTGGFITNLIYCLYMNRKNRTGGEIKKSSSSVFSNNILFCALAGLLWYSQFFGLGMGQSFFEPGSVMMAFSWSILMSLNVVFSNVWGIILKEWKGAGKRAVIYLALGMAVLIFSLIIPNLF